MTSSKHSEAFDVLSEYTSGVFETRMGTKVFVSFAFRDYGYLQGCSQSAFERPNSPNSWIVAFFWEAPAGADWEFPLRSLQNSEMDLMDVHTLVDHQGRWVMVEDETEDGYPEYPGGGYAC